MAGELVLITGVTGHIGFRVLRYALEYGYQVRAAVRNQAKVEVIRSNPALKALNKDDQLSFVIVPDILATNAYEEAIKDVKYVIHVASPLPGSSIGTDLEAALIQPAIQGTLNILKAAQKTPTIQRIVITSSVAAITPGEAFVGGPISQRVDADTRQPNPSGPYESAFIAYGASKTLAFNKAEEWLRAEKPAFDVIHIHPSFVEGRNDLTTTSKDLVSSGTNAVLMSAILGVNGDPQGTSTNSVDDTAWVHVKALDPSIPGNQSFLTASPGDDGVGWDDSLAIVAKHFPEAVRDGRLPNNGHTPSLFIPFDSSKTEKTFGFKLASFESQVVSVVSHYLELLEKEQGGKQ